MTEKSNKKYFVGLFAVLVLVAGIGSMTDAHAYETNLHKKIVANQVAQQKQNQQANPPAKFSFSSIFGKKVSSPSSSSAPSAPSGSSDVKQTSPAPKAPSAGIKIGPFTIGKSSTSGGKSGK